MFSATCACAVAVFPPKVSVVDITESARWILRFLRESRGYSLEGLVARMRDEDRIAASTLDKWERGPTQLTFENAELLLETLEIPLDFFFKLPEAHQRAFGAKPAYALPEQPRLPIPWSIGEQTDPYGGVSTAGALVARVGAAERMIKDNLQDLVQSVYVFEVERRRERGGPPQPSPSPPRRAPRSRKANAGD